MSQEMNQLPIRHSASSATAETAGGAAAGAAKGLVKWGLILGLGVPLAIGAVLGGIVALAGGGVAAALTVGLITAAFGFIATPSAFTLGSILGGTVGAFKGGKEAHTRVQHQMANANVLDAQLQAAAMDAQARMMQAQAAAPQRPRYSAPEQFNQASPTIMASNDNQVHGTVAQAPERQVGA